MNKFFKTAKLETYIYLLIFGFTGFIFFKFFYPLLKRALGTEELIKEEQNEEQHLKDIDTELEYYKKKYTFSYPVSDYFNFANGIYNSVGLVYDDPTLVNDYLRKLNHNLDYIQLKISFGKKLSGIYYFGREWRNLEEYLQYYYNDDKDVIKKFNEILKSKNIKYRI